MVIYMENTIQKVADILESNDGRTFEEKKQEVINYLKGQEDTLLAEHLLKTAINEERAERWKEKFWESGDTLPGTEYMVLRKVCETDKVGFINLQKETSVLRSMLKEEVYCNMLWNEHTQKKSLMITIEVNGEYAGYCGINNLAQEHLEIAIELLKKWRHKGIGYIAISTLLSEIKSRMHINEFRVKIEPTNYASQRLFEKLGAVPYEIVEFMWHGETDILNCEKETVKSIDDKLIKVASKFNVDSRKLLNCVLEYKLDW